ncbi:hypothetical protein HY464_01450 [Candidatus Peregrinibacteria bacterium]|nr:hypothetical protein [Candidatus Peregrinibacteria bacterium]MBI4129339.1 hypothetical protein [Candidatus Peregrinibacteria bacterium]
MNRSPTELLAAIEKDLLAEEERLKTNAGSRVGFLVLFVLGLVLLSLGIGHNNTTLGIFGGLLLIVLHYGTSEQKLPFLRIAYLLALDRVEKEKEKEEKPQT